MNLFFPSSSSSPVPIKTNKVKPLQGKQARRKKEEMQLWRGLKKPAPKQALLLPSHWVVDGKNSNILQLSDDGLIINAQPQDSRMV